MGNDASRMAAHAHGGGRRIKLNVESTYAEEYKVGLARCFERYQVPDTSIYLSLFDVQR